MASVRSRAAEPRQWQGNAQKAAEDRRIPQVAAGPRTAAAGNTGLDSTSQDHSKTKAVLMSDAADECIQTAQRRADDSSTRDEQHQVLAPVGVLAVEDQVDSSALAATRSALAAMGLLDMLQVCSHVYMAVDAIPDATPFQDAFAAQAVHGCIDAEAFRELTAHLGWSLSEHETESAFKGDYSADVEVGLFLVCRSIALVISQPLFVLQLQIDRGILLSTMKSMSAGGCSSGAVL